MEDEGGGWNAGKVELAIANKTNTIIWFERIYFSDIFVETKEGVTYPAQINNIEQHIGPSSAFPVLPNTQFSNVPKFSNLKGASWEIQWRSAISATPIRVVFPRYPEFNFDLPTKKETTLSFPFITDTNIVQSVTSLEGVELPIFQDQLEATFTGRCLTTNNRYFDAIGYYLQFDVINSDAFQEKQGRILVQRVLLTDDGYMYYDEIYSPSIQFFGEQTGASSVDIFTISLGPGQSAVGSLGFGSYDFAGGGESAFAVLIWPDGNFTLYEMSPCTLIER